ncbi:furry homolog-like protein [Tanacetum coccineum]
MHWIRIKQSKHIAVAYPLVTLLLCLGDPVVFLNNFGPHMEQLYKHLRDKNNMFMALDCLHHVLRFYMSVHGNSQPPNRVWDYLDSVTAQLLTIPQERVMLTGMKTDAPPKVKEIAKWKSLKNGHFDCPLTEGRYDGVRWPHMLKFKDCSPSKHHAIKAILILPLKEYTHPRDGYLNLATKLPRISLKPDMGPKIQIGYGFAQELGHVIRTVLMVDSITFGHEMVNILVSGEEYDKVFNHLDMLNAPFEGKPTNKCVGPGKKAHGFRVELGGDVGSDLRRSGFVFVLGASTNTVASKGGERRMFAKYDEEEYSDDVNYDDKILNEETPIGFVKSDDDDVSQKDNSRNDEDVLWNLLKESIMLRRNLREKAKKSAQLQKDKEVNGKPSMINPARLPNTANGCKPKPRNWQASMSSRVSNKDVHLGEHRKQKPFLKFNDLQCPTCKKCLYSANHDECVLQYLSRLNPRAST